MLNRYLLFTVIGLLVTLTATAQKLPNKQTNGLRAPAHVKIDGKDTEWHNQFQAYNKATELYYTMANDKENLYLSLQTNQPDIINRIMKGGISLSIQKTAKKEDNSSVSITYPVTENKLYLSSRKRRNQEEDTTAKTADSVMKVNNGLIKKSCKWILVTGIRGVDTLISIYNLNGIKAAGLFDSKKVFTCEFSVKIDHLKNSMDSGQKFNYHIRLNGSKTPTTITITSNTPGDEVFIQQLQDRANALGAQQAASTDFWAEYTLVK